MKLKHLLFGVFVALAVAACTKDNAGVTPENGDKMATADKYISINLKMPAGAATRAADTEAGTPEENAVKKATFLFFKDGSQVAEPFTIAAGGNDANNEVWTPGVDAKKKPVIVMKNPTDIPTSLVVLINYGGTVTKSTNLNALQAEVADYSGTENGFVMSNSVYNEASSNVIGAPVTSENIKETPEDAKANPVKVYVERVLAKVTIAADDALEPKSGYKNITIDVTDGEFKVEGLEKQTEYEVYLTYEMEYNGNKLQGKSFAKKFKTGLDPYTLTNCYYEDDGTNLKVVVEVDDPNRTVNRTYLVYGRKRIVLDTISAIYNLSKELLGEEKLYLEVKYELKGDPNSTLTDRYEIKQK